MQLKHQHRASGSYLKYLIQQRSNRNANISSRILSNSSPNITARKYLEARHHLKNFGKLVTECKHLDDSESHNFLIRAMNTTYSRINSYLNCVDFLDIVFPNYHHGSCADCSHLGHSNDFYNVEDDYSVCENCRDDYYWNDAQGYYQRDEWYDDRDDDDDEDEEYSDYKNIGSYHSSKRKLGHIPSSFDNRKPRVLLGLELEMETDAGRHSKDERAGHLLDIVGKYKNHQYALCEEDGSLDNGFEMVTSYTGLDVHKTQLEFFKHRFESMSSHNTSTCGLHIHICKSDMSTLHGAKMVFFINDANNLELVKAIARRDSASYAKLVDKKSDKSWLKQSVKGSKNKFNQLKGLNYDRYESLNFQNDRTIEFRLFKGSLKYETIMACLEFTYATWHFCKDASIDQLTTKDFISFICKPENKQDTRFLRVYLKNKGFDLCVVPKVCSENYLKLVA
jgi:hypothetical protein